MSLDQFQGSQNGNSDEGSSIDLRHYFYLLWQWAWLILLATAVAGASAYFVSHRMTPIFSTSTKLLIIEAASNKPTDYNSVLTSERLARTYSDLMTNEAVLQEVIDRLQLQMTPIDLAEMITVAPVRDTQLIDVSVEGASPAQIALIANALVQVLIERVSTIQSDRYSSSEESLSLQLTEIETVLQGIQDQLDTLVDPLERERLASQEVQYRQIYANVLTTYEQTRLAEAQSSANIVQINEAQLPLESVSPKILQNTILAGLLAALLVVGVVFALDALDDTIKTPEQAEQALGLPVMGIIFQHQNGAGPISADQPRAPVSEAFRSLRTNVQFANIDNPLRTLLVTSPSPSEGKTLVSANLAVVMAQGGKHVILVDADLRKPAVHKRLNISNTQGTTTLILQPEFVLEDVMQTTSTAGLSALSSGDLPPNPAELLGSRKMGAVVEKLKEASDLVIFDTPPVLPVADPVILATMVDGVLLVLQPGTTTTAAARQAVENLRRVNARILGVVLNNVSLKGSRYQYYYRKGYRYYQSADPHASGKVKSARFKA